MAPRAFPLALAAALLAPAPAPAVEPPNIVLILLDDVGYGDLGADGGSFVATPVLDALAAEGMRFTQFHASAPLCNPSRAAILTGLDPVHLGLRARVDTDSQRGVPAGVETLADRLRSAGYATGHFGKWHLGSRPEHLPTRRGFDHSMIPVVANASYLDREISIDDAEPVVAAGHMTEVTTDYAIAFLDAHADRPFFLNLWYNAAHKPYEPPQRWAERYPPSEAGLFAATLSHADEQIGRVLGALHERGLDSRTLVLVAGDNGGLPIAGVSAAALRGQKGDVFEGGLRVPLIARWPGAIAPGTTNASLALGIDLVPTLAELAGAAPPSVLPGRSLVPALLAGAELAREGPVAWETTDRIEPEDPALSPLAYAVRRGSWKLVRSQAAQPDEPMLFDLASDPSESIDVAAAHPELVAELETAYRLWRAREARVEPPVLLESGASAVGPWLRFSEGVVELAADPRLRLHDGDFSLRARVIPADLEASQVIAAQPGSWSLALEPDGSLEVSISRDDGSRASLASPPRLRPGVAADVAFSVFGARSWIDLRILVAGRLEARTLLSGAMVPSDAPVRFGNGRAGARPFRGTLWDPGLFVVPLDAPDLVDLDFDGVPNAEDDCIGAPNGPARPEATGEVQRDEDADAIGTACDPDFDADGRVGVTDMLALFPRFGRPAPPGSPEARFDLDGTGAVSLLDYLLVGNAFGQPPGPSGLHCTVSAPCLDPLPAQAPAAGRPGPDPASE